MLDFRLLNRIPSFHILAGLMSNPRLLGRNLGCWKVDAMVDTHGNQVHLSYQQYTANYPGSSTPYVRDAELATVSYDSPTCQNTSTICPTSGTAPNLWQPLVQVIFDQATKPTRLTAADTTCQNWSSSNTNTRCDTATDASGGIAGPQVTTAAVLNAIEVQASPTGTPGSFHVLRASEMDTTQRYDSSTTVTTRAFFDGWGKVAETRTPG